MGRLNGGQVTGQKGGEGGRQLWGGVMCGGDYELEKNAFFNEERENRVGSTVKVQDGSATFGAATMDWTCMGRCHEAAGGVIGGCGGDWGRTRWKKLGRTQWMVAFGLVWGGKIIPVGRNG
ncbi:Uncharacterized protein Fot_25393 [Forsythia ovata]|uniref:Uncharacterized protein n=1 Tax=Forsythia ovata TaxID=205694 RepID=A0ABD1U8Z4_9LAMI